MQSKQQLCDSLSRTISGVATAALAFAILFALTVVLTQSAAAQTFTDLYRFTDGTDGAWPDGLIMDRAGNLYGAAGGGIPGCGGNGCGTVYKMSHKGSGWVFSPLYSFAGGNDGMWPGGMVLGPDGSLYGTNGGGGGCKLISFGCGTVFNLRPQPSPCKTALCPWSETVLYTFTGRSDGASPDGDLVFDQAGNLYGTAAHGGHIGGDCGDYGCGTVFKLTPSNGGWTESVLYSFTGSSDGIDPMGGVVFDSAGNLYGTTYVGGAYGYGCVFQLTPSGSGWTEHTLYSFPSETDGNPMGGVTLDQYGNVYGSIPSGGPYDGMVFELTQGAGGWGFSVLYSFTGGGPQGKPLMDKAGNLYGATYQDGLHRAGNIFELTPSNGGWSYTDLYDFTGGTDGGYPTSNNLIFDANGNLFGTTVYGGYWGGPCLNEYGRSGCGVVWEITP